MWRGISGLLTLSCPAPPCVDFREFSSVWTLGFVAELTDRFGPWQGDADTDERGMHCLERLITARLSELQLLSVPGEQVVSKGRHGPTAARMSKKNVYGGRLTIASDDRLEALDDYVTCRSRAGVSAGKWMFEVLVRSTGLLQVSLLFSIS